MDARVLHRLLLLSLIVGLAFSSFATFETYYAPLRTSCTINAFFSCGAVDQSSHTTIGPVPDWAIGLGGFVAMLALDVPLIRSYDPRYLYGVLVLATVGLALAIGLGILEVTVIHALCPICLGAYLSDAGAFGVALGLVRMRRSARAAPSARAGSAVAED
ncbi:MAG TPA: vitamin K epoxide reductase family protein [Thermoplasmata archaeon]|nr:vitamin K epoxide reductase family protein [Thermoplasmata archaeon]